MTIIVSTIKRIVSNINMENIPKHKVEVISRHYPMKYHKIISTIEYFANALP